MPDEAPSVAAAEAAVETARAQVEAAEAAGAAVVAEQAAEEALTAAGIVAEQAAAQVAVAREEAEAETAEITQASAAMIADYVEELSCLKARMEAAEMMAEARHRALLEELAFAPWRRERMMAEHETARAVDGPRESLVEEPEAPVAEPAPEAEEPEKRRHRPRL